MITSIDDLRQSVERDAQPPDELSAELKALWHARKGNWHEAHEIAQDIPSAMGSWIHAHLHLIEGDLGNASYWYHKAGKPASPPSRIPEEWETIVRALL